MTQLEQYYTVPEVAERFHCSNDAVKKHLAASPPKPKLAKTKFGDRTLVSEAAIQRFLSECAAFAEAKKGQAA